MDKDFYCHSDELHKCNQAAPIVVDMSKAEDDEMVLQEVIVDQNGDTRALVQRSQSLQTPGTGREFSKPKDPQTNLLRGLSPKIAPKFPREKLKSMFCKRRLSSAIPFYKLKGVRFSRGTKNDESVSESLLSVYNEPVEVDITLSTPELTEIEKETGVHPYYYTQQTTTPKQLATERALTSHQAVIEHPSLSGQKKGRVQSPKCYLDRPNSLPNLTQPDEFARYARDPIMASSLKKISEIIKKKDKHKKGKEKKKSSSPNDTEQKDHTTSVGAQGSDKPEEAESLLRRNTLPQITVTKCEPKAQEHLDLAIAVGASQDQGERDGSAQEASTTSKTEQSPESSETNLPDAGRRTSDTHSTFKKPQPSTPSPDKLAETEPTQDMRPKFRKKSPPPKRPGKLTFSKAEPARYIAGISLRSRAPASPEDTPSSPPSSIPTATSRGHTPLFPKPQERTEKHSPTSELPTALSQTSGTCVDVAIKIYDSTENLAEDESHPPVAPQRRITRTTSKGKK